MDKGKAQFLTNCFIISLNRARNYTFLRTFAAENNKKMNLYIRFFNDETIVTSAEAAISFISRVTNDQVEDSVYQQLTNYFKSSTPYPRRFKVHARTYFICIKTNAETIEEFKTRGQQQEEQEETAMETATETVAETKDEAQPHEEPVAEEPQHEVPRTKASYEENKPGWYEAEILFKRVLYNEEKGKNEYVDTAFKARVKAHSAKECYTKVCDHLLAREDIDSRSQMPSIKGRNFSCKYLGMKL